MSCSRVLVSDTVEFCILTHIFRSKYSETFRVNLHNSGLFRSDILQLEKLRKWELAYCLYFDVSRQENLRPNFMLLFVIPLNKSIQACSFNRMDHQLFFHRDIEHKRVLNVRNSVKSIKKSIYIYVD